MYRFVESFFCAAFGARFMPLWGMQACLQHSLRCDLCRNDGALPYGDILTFLKEKSCHIMEFLPWRRYVTQQL